MTAATICLSMIVKDESAVIERCLASVREIIDYWVICDTGSTDDTHDLVRAALAGIPGEFHQRPWVSFGHNRSEVLQLAQPKADYSLILDADMVAHVHEPFKDRLQADAYLLRYEGNLDYYQTMLVSNRHRWTYIGVTHEYISSETVRPSERLLALTLSHFADGGARADKFRRDIQLLEQDLEVNPNNERSMFYLAQSYRDAGDHAHAITWYQARVDAGGWDQEVWYSLYQIASLRQAIGAAWPEVLEAYLAAYAFRPSRLEPLYPVAKHYRLQEQYQIAYLFARTARETRYPEDILFIDRSVYTYKLPMELGICSYYLGRHADAVATYNRLLERVELPPAYADTAIRNRAFSLPHLHTARPSTVSKKRNRLKVVVPFYNPGNFLDNCVASLQTQDYDHFEAIFVDDYSDDGSHEKVPEQDARFTLIRTQRRFGGARNLHTILTDFLEPDDIAVLVDGDDWLACTDALSYVNDFYNTHDCWVMYGQFRYSSGHYGTSKPYTSPASFERVRAHWYSSHLRTFRAGLYHRIADTDPDYRCMKDRAGNWYTTAMDMAVMYPVLELAGYGRVRYNDRVLYVYNTDNPLNVHKIDPDAERRSAEEIVAKPSFAKIESYRLAVDRP